MCDPTPYNVHCSCCKVHLIMCKPHFFTNTKSFPFLYTSCCYLPFLFIRSSTGGWSKHDHFHFVYLMEQYPPELPNRRMLYVDRMLREMPHKTRSKLVRNVAGPGHGVIPVDLSAFSLYTVNSLQVKIRSILTFPHSAVSSLRTQMYFRQK